MLRETVSTPAAPGAIGPYSQAVIAQGSLLFLSGQIPLLPSGELLGGSVADQTHQCLKNLNAVLESRGLSFANVVKTTIFLSSMEHFPHVNEVYMQYVTADPPARSTVAVAGLPRGVDVEIEAIAVY